ncbi:TadE/TadG family type IV pilus assembly protein [Methylobacterium sp. ID0610]|uniref:TadE/TadG family type IV pilus assembly protein n=1 Tax=Methylobacterium carpenticola TaxID=3344827 RepID=UPI00367376D2
MMSVPARRRRAGFGPDQSGAAALEFAFILPPLLVLLFGIVEGGRLLWAYNVLQFAVEAAARCAVIDQAQCGTTSLVQTYAAAKTYALNPDPGIFSVDTLPCGTQVAGRLTVTTLGPVAVTVTLEARSCRPR